MPYEWKNGYTDFRANLLSCYYKASEKIKTGKENEAKLNAYRQRLAVLEKELGDTIECANHLKDIYKNIEHYANEHKNKVKNILDLAIIEAGNLVPDADVGGIHLEHTNDNRVFVSNDKGQNINIREGCGYRAVLGALIKYACIKAQPDALQFMLFDEYFFTLSDTTTASMKAVFEAMKKDIIIVCIEQRRNAMDGILDCEYNFKKGEDKITRVTKVL